MLYSWMCGAIENEKLSPKLRGDLLDEAVSVAAIVRGSARRLWKQMPAEVRDGAGAELSVLGDMGDDMLRELNGPAMAEA